MRKKKQQGNVGDDRKDENNIIQKGYFAVSGNNAMWEQNKIC